MGLEGLEFCWAGLLTARASDSERMAAGRSCSAAVRARWSERFLEIMSHRHVRWRVDGGQEAERGNRVLCACYYFGCRANYEFWLGFPKILFGAGGWSDFASPFVDLFFAALDRAGAGLGRAKKSARGSGG